VLELPHTHGADLADARGPGPLAGRLEIHHDKGRVFEQDVGARRIGQTHRIAAPGQAVVVTDHLFEQAAGEVDGRVPEGEEPPGRLLRVDRPPPLFDQLDEPIRRVQSQLHDDSLGEHMFVCNDRAEMTLSQLALTVLLLAGLGLVAHRLGVSAIPAYLLSGLLLGPHEPHVTSLITPSDVTEFVAELGIVFLLFFLGLEFSLGRLGRTGRHVGLGGTLDLLTNAAVGLLVGLAAFGLSFGALILAAAVYVSSSAITVKGLIDFRRLADEETDLVLAILLFEDLAIAVVLGFAATGGGSTASTLGTVGKAIAFIGISLAAARWLTQPLDRVLDWLPREFFLLFVVGILVGMAALAEELGLSEAIGALMAGVVLAETSVREEIEERFFSFRDLFAALFFFVFGLSIDVGALGRLGWLLALAVPLTILGKTAAGYFAGRVGGFTRRQSFNAGVALIAHGEFTIILAQLAAGNSRLSDAVQSDLTAFAGLYVLATATVGVVLMKESKWIGRRLFPAPTLISEER
jgi:CPA2 family monovalent cation:H+ antiporter-2